MEKIHTRRTIIKTIEEEVEGDVFMAKDGTLFDIEEECLKHDENIDFSAHFNTKYKVKQIDPSEYGLSYQHASFCHLVYIKKISDKIIDEFVRFYELHDHPDDIIKLKEGWSFVALVSDVNLWVFDKTDRMFIVESLEDVIKEKNKHLNLLKELKCQK